MSARCIAAAVLFAAAFGVHAESIRYELYDITGGGPPALLAKGVREYTVRDVVVEAHGSMTERFWSKEIPVTNGFSAGASIFPEREVSGFGLWLKDRDSFWGKFSSGGFSWDWFDRETDNVFRKLQGPGRVRATFAPAPSGQQLTSVEVLEDITLRARIRPWFFAIWNDSETHHLVVRKGSVLRFAP